ncbi:hypothetical protein PMH09_05600 [Roseofilum sp. BLCC_M143]|uniref:Transposase n=1 Tax=Roseofilum casamattae BLCC-M143 TaxID=3022442 RepID=A0ABT7BU02_9CYAN|nr:hypothetical protein [Roseofilum casamattae BLCC-M143]
MLEQDRWQMEDGNRRMGRSRYTESSYPNSASFRILIPYLQGMGTFSKL